MEKMMYAVFFRKEKMPQIIQDRSRDLNWVKTYNGKIKKVAVEYKPNKKTFEVWEVKRTTITKS